MCEKGEGFKIAWNRNKWDMNTNSKSTTSEHAQYRVLPYKFIVLYLMVYWSGTIRLGILYTIISAVSNTVWFVFVSFITIEKIHFKYNQLKNNYPTKVYRIISYGILIGYNSSWYIIYNYKCCFKHRLICLRIFYHHRENPFYI